MTITAKHEILIVGGGTAGITVAVRLLRKGYTDVAVIEPSSTDRRRLRRPSATSPR